MRDKEITAHASRQQACSSIGQGSYLQTLPDKGKILRVEGIVCLFCGHFSGTAAWSRRGNRLKIAEWNNIGKGKNE